MSISFPYISNSNLWVLPDGCRAQPDFFEVNLSKANAYDVLDALGLSTSSDEDPMPIGAFSNILSTTLRRYIGHRSPAIDKKMGDSPGHMRTTFLGRDAGYIEQRMFDLAKLVLRSKTIGATHIGWG
jgi:hypothetical protein